MTSIAVGTVYRNLNLMTEAGEIMQIPLPDRPDRYDKNTFPHNHMLCSVCGELSDIDIPDMTGMIEIYSGGGKVESYNLIAYGICGRCMKSKEQKTKI
jgi:Fe2+ or Zn2+ uptake regulation protein